MGSSIFQLSAIPLRLSVCCLLYFRLSTVLDKQLGDAVHLGPPICANCESETETERLAVPKHVAQEALWQSLGIFEIPNAFWSTFGLGASWPDGQWRWRRAQRRPGALLEASSTYIQLYNVAHPVVIPNCQPSKTFIHHYRFGLGSQHTSNPDTQTATTDSWNFSWQSGRNSTYTKNRGTCGMKHCTFFRVFFEKMGFIFQSCISIIAEFIWI